MSTKFGRFLRSRTGLLTLTNLLSLLVIVALVGQTIGWWDLASLMGTAGLPPPTYPAPIGGYTCLPSCADGVAAPQDGKFLLISNSGMATFSGSKIVAWIAVAGDQASFELGIFDGDSGKDNAGNLNYKAGNWDEMQNEATFTLYADPLKDGSGTQVISEWHGNQDPMPNNGWFNVTVNNIAEAKGPSRHYFYRLEITQAIESRGGNAFKLRSTGYLSTGQAGVVDAIRSDLVGASLAIIGQWATANDTIFIYPEFQGDYNNLGPSNYTGDWAFSFYVPNDQTTMEFWDGDFDRGSTPDVFPDTDDINTVGKPEWALNNPYVMDERAGGKGAPADDASHVGYRREPPVKYELIDPEGTPIYVNEEPSGTEEWERFVMSTDASVEPDLLAERVQPGYYTLHIQGLDMHNLVFVRLNFEICDPEDGCGPTPWNKGGCAMPLQYWKSNVRKVLIQGKTKGVQETRETLEWALRNAALMSPLFRSGINIYDPEPLGDPVRLSDQEADDILQRAGGNTMLDKALQYNLAMWLNLGAGYLDPNAKVHMDVYGGPFDGTNLQALKEAQGLIFAGDEDGLKRARQMAEFILYGGTYEEPPKAPIPPAPAPVEPPPPPDPGTCGARINTYVVENPTTSPFYGVKFQFSAGTEVKDGGYDVFKLTLPNDTVAALTSLTLEAIAADAVGQVLLEGIDFTSPLPMGEPIKDANNWFAFYFTGAIDNGDGTKTLAFQVQNFTIAGLGQVTISLPDGVVPSAPTGSYESQVCP
jgi:hypothetical protein